MATRTITVMTNSGEITRKATWRKDGVYISLNGARVRVYSENGKWYTQDYEPVAVADVESPAVESPVASKKTASKKNAYEPAALHRVYDKITGECLGYLAPKLDEKGEPEGWHKVTSDERGEWHCDCVGNAEFHRECKHIKAAKELCEIRVKAGKPARWTPAVSTQEETPQVTPLSPEEKKRRYDEFMKPSVALETVQARAIARKLPGEESNVVQIASHARYTGSEGNLNTGNEFSLLKKAV